MEYFRWSGDLAGLSNRLLGFAAAQVVANEVGRPLAMVWASTPHFPACYQEILKTKVRILPAYYGIRFDLNSAGWNPAALWREAVDRGFIKMSLEEFVKLTRRQLRGLDFQDSIRAGVVHLTTGFDPTRALGIHIRETDNLIHKKSEARNDPRRLRKILGTKTFLAMRVCSVENTRRLLRYRLTRNVSNILSEYDIDCVYVASDSAAGLNYIRRKLNGMPVFHNTSIVYNTDDYRQTSMVDAATDLLMLSKCKYLVTNFPHSTFVLTAALLGDAKLLGDPCRHEIYRLISEDSAE